MKRVFAVAATAAVATVLVACGSGDDGSDGGSSDPVTLGMALGETGFMSAYDPGVRISADMAIEELNAKGGIDGRQIEVVDSDSQSTPEGSASAGLAVLDEGADMVISSGDFDVGGPACAEAQKLDVVCMSAGAASTKFGPAGIGPLAFTTATAAISEGGAIAEWAFKEKGWKNAYVLEDTTLQYTKEIAAGFRETWESLGGNVEGDVFKTDDASIATQIAGLKRLNPQPDVIYLAALPAAALKQIRAAGINTPVLGPESYDGEAWKDAVPNIGEMYYTTYGSMYGDDPEADVNQFFKDYKKKAGKNADWGGVLAGYTSVQALARAAEKAGSFSGPEVQAALETFDEEPLLIGPTTFNETDHITLKRPSRIMKIADGKSSFEQLYEISEVPDVQG